MSSFGYHVGQRIKKYRKSRGYTIEKFSAMIGKSKATVSKYENGTITLILRPCTILHRSWILISSASLTITPR